MEHRMTILDDLDIYSNLLLSVNTHKSDRPLEPIEVAELIADLKKETNETWNEIASRIGIGKDQINAFRKLLKLPKQVHYAIGWGDTNEDKLAFTTASIIAELDEEEEMEILCKVALSNKLKKEETERVLQLKKMHISKNIKECVNDVLKLRPIIEIGYIIVSSVHDTTLTRLKSLADETNRNLEILIIYLINKVLTNGSIKKAIIRNKTVLLTMDEKAYESIHKIQISKRILFKQLFEYLVNEAMKNEL
jgi:hypothetical protein